jgi:hypothetical protein
MSQFARNKNNMVVKQLNCHSTTRMHFISSKRVAKQLQKVSCDKLQGILLLVMSVNGANKLGAAC